MKQVKNNEDLNNKLLANSTAISKSHEMIDHILVSIKGQLYFNKAIESQLNQLKTLVPSLSQSVANIDAVTTRGGKTTRDPPNPNMTGKATKPRESTQEKEELPKEDDNIKVIGRTAPNEYYDTNVLLPFPHPRKQSADEQFRRFVEVIHKVYVNILLLDAMQVPTYSKYLRDILNNKRPIPTTEVVQLIEECSAAILNQAPLKKKDPGCPTIDCSIGT